MAKMRYFFSVWILGLLWCIPSYSYAKHNPLREIIPEKYAAIVVDYRSGKVLHAENAEIFRYPASLTKLMTLYLVFEALEKGTLSLDQPLLVSSHAASQQPSKLALKAGQTISVEDAILGVVIKSANDAAIVLAEAIGGTEIAFADMMTQRAQTLGMNDTEFFNASGLPHPQQHTTAADMAKLALALMQHFPSYYSYFNARYFIYNGQRFTTHNRLINYYEGMDGLKTGYIHDSGFNLVASAVRNGQRLVAVVLGGRTARLRDRHMANLLNQAFDQSIHDISNLSLERY